MTKQIYFIFGLLSCLSLNFADDKWVAFSQKINACVESRAINELNRALHEFRMLHGSNYRIDSISTDILIPQLEQQTYLHEPEYRYVSRDLSFDGLSFSSNLYDKKRLHCNSLNKIGQMQLVRLLKESKADLRLFALQYISKNKVKPPVTSVLMSFLNEPEAELYPVFFDVIKLEKFYKNKPLHIPQSIQKKIVSLAAMPVNNTKRAQVVYLCVAFTEHRPKIDISVLVDLFDHDYPFDFLLKLFKSYPPKYLEEFIVPLQQGYGDQWEKIIRLFARFPENEKILDCLFHLLVNRDQKHYPMIQGAIINSLETLTGLSWNNNDKPYIDWYKQQKSKFMH